MPIEHGEMSRPAGTAHDHGGTLPESLYRIIRGFMPSRCILTALELDLFTAVEDGASADQVAARIDASPRGTDMLLNAMVALGFLTKDGGIFRNTPESAQFFTSGSSQNRRDGLLHTADIWHNWSTLTGAVRSGTRVPIESTAAMEWTRNFIAGMQLNAKDRAPLVVKALGAGGVRRVLDLGGGSGVYSIAFAQAAPEVRCEILDLPEVVPLTADYIRQGGVEGQVSVRAGNMLGGDFGSGYDLILLNAICHMFSAEQNRQLFRSAYSALAPHGRLAVQDFILDAEKTSPQQAALFSLNMLVGTDAGACYTQPEYSEWMDAAGFSPAIRIDLPGPSDLLVGRK